MLKLIEAELNELLNESDDVEKIDYIDLKVCDEKTQFKSYFFEGHYAYRKYLDDKSREFIENIRSLNCYGLSEVSVPIPFNESSGINKLHIKLNISCTEQYYKVLTFLKSLVNIAVDTESMLNDFEQTILKMTEDADYYPLYFVGFNYDKNTGYINSVSLYFKTFGLDDSMNSNEDYIKLFSNNQLVKNDNMFKIIKRLVKQDMIILRSIGFEISNSGKVKIKYYLKVNPDIDIMEIDAIKDAVKKAEQYVDYIQKRGDLDLDIIQLSGGYFYLDKSVSLYYAPRRVKDKYYSLNANMRLRDIGGIYFLIDICDKSYYKNKKLFNINETGKRIIMFLEKNVCTLEGVVSYICSQVINYSDDMYEMIYEDCKEFISDLEQRGYIVQKG